MRSIGFIALIWGLIFSSYCFWEPDIARQKLVAAYEASQNGDNFRRDHPEFSHVRTEDERADQLLNVIYGFGIAIMGLGLIHISYKQGATIAPTNATL